MNHILSWLFVLIISVCSLSAQESRTDSSGMRWGVVAQFDYGILDLAGIRLQLHRDQALFFQGKFNWDYPDNNGNVFGYRSRMWISYDVIAGYEHRVMTVSQIDIVLHVALEKTRSLVRERQEKYHYDTFTNQRIQDAVAQTESDYGTWSVLSGIGAQYHITDNFSLSLIQRGGYTSDTQRETYIDSPSTVMKSRQLYFANVFLNIIYLF